jgi:hypothetical protein
MHYIHSMKLWLCLHSRYLHGLAPSSCHIAEYLAELRLTRVLANNVNMIKHVTHNFT